MAYRMERVSCLLSKHALDKIVLYALVDRLYSKFFIVLPGKDYDWYSWCFFQHTSKRCLAPAVGEIEVKQHQRRRIVT